MKMISLAFAALLASAVVAGCGGDSNSTSTTTTPLADAVDKYVGTYQGNCVWLTKTVGSTAGTSYLSKITLSKSSSTTLSGTGLDTQYNTTSNCTGTYTQSTSTGSFTYQGSQTIEGVVVDKMIRTTSANPSAVKLGMYFNANNTAVCTTDPTSPLDANGYPTKLDATGQSCVPKIN